MSEAMSAEFDTVAEWTARVARELGPEYHVPAGCRGSGSPAALDWLMHHLGLMEGERLLDCGAGIGGPAAYAVGERAVQPLLVEPEAGAIRASQSLFGYPAIRAAASALPLGDDTVDAAWALGVLCTTEEQLGLLRELSRVVRRPGKIGLLVLVAESTRLDEQPEGNHFPTAEALRSLVDDADLRVEAWCGASDLDPISPEWSGRVDEVTAELAQRYGGDRAWHQAEHQSALIGRLIEKGQVTTDLLALRHR